MLSIRFTVPVPMQAPPAGASMPTVSPRISYVKKASLLATLGDKPFHALLQARAVLRAASLDGPLAIPDVVKLKCVLYLLGRHSLQQVLLVGKHQQCHAAKFVLRKQLSKLRAALLEAPPI